MAKLIEWRDEYSIGIEEIDNQHEVLADLVNEVGDAVQQHHDARSVREILARLAAHTRDHFAREERLMSWLGYPLSRTHQLQHLELAEQIDGYQRQVARGEIDGSELLFFLKNWLIQHILGGDDKFARFSAQNGDPMEPIFPSARTKGR